MQILHLSLLFHLWVTQVFELCLFLSKTVISLIFSGQSCVSCCPLQNTHKDGCSTMGLSSDHCCMLCLSWKPQPRAASSQMKTRAAHFACQVWPPMLHKSKNTLVQKFPAFRLLLVPEPEPGRLETSAFSCCWQVQEEGRERGSRRVLCKLWHDFNEQVHSLGRAQLGAQQQSRPRFLWGLVPFQQVEVMSATAHCLLTATASSSNLGGRGNAGTSVAVTDPSQDWDLFISENQASPFVCTGSTSGQPMTHLLFRK